MPSLGSEEIERRKRFTAFCESPETRSVTLTLHEEGAVRVLDCRVDLVLEAIELTTYSEGGCGNCVGKVVRVRTRVSRGASLDEAVLELGPGTRTADFAGGFRLAVGDGLDRECAKVFVGLAAPAAASRRGSLARMARWLGMG